MYNVNRKQSSIFSKDLLISQKAGGKFSMLVYVASDVRYKQHKYESAANKYLAGTKHVLWFP